MKKLIVRAFFVLVIMSALSSSAFAANTSYSADSGGCIIQASQYISSYDSLITAASGGVIKLDCGVTGTGIMSSIGVKTLQIQKLQSGVWVTTLTETNLYEYDCMSASVYATYQGSIGSQYRAVITFYAANSSGSDTRIMTTNSVVAAN